MNVDIIHAVEVFPQFRKLADVLLYSQSLLRGSSAVKHVIPRSLLMCPNVKSIILRGLQCDKLPEGYCHFQGLKRLSVVGSPKLRCLPKLLSLQKELSHLSVVRCPALVEIEDEILQRLKDSKWARPFGKRVGRAQENGLDESNMENHNNRHAFEDILQLRKGARSAGKDVAQ